MKKLFLLLFLTPLLCFGQLRVLPGVARKSGAPEAPPVVGNIEDITISALMPQYQDESVSITATPAGGIAVTHWRWRIIKRSVNTDGSWDTTMVATSTVQNPTFLGTITETGFYDVKLTARNSVDKYIAYEYRLFMMFPPRFDEGDADLVVDMSAGALPNSKFYDYRLAGAQPGFKIYIKGQTTNGQVQFVDLRGTEDDPVYIIKESNNTQVHIEFSGGNGKVLFFSRFTDTNSDEDGARYVILNGFNLDGTPGITCTGGASSVITVRVEGKITDIGIFGLEVVADPETIDGAGIAMGPYVSAGVSKTTWATNNLHVYGCTITAGEEGVYLGESNQDPGYVGNNGFPPPSGIGAVVARNTVLGAGRDAYQIGCMGYEMHDNYGQNWAQQNESGHRAFFNSNDGSYGRVFKNKGVGGPMSLSIKSGEYPWSPLAGHTTPQPVIVEYNVFSNGSDAGTAEPFSIYIQNNPLSGAGNWTVSVRNNTLDSKNKSCEFLVALGGFSSNNFFFANNIVIKTGDAGDTQDLNFAGNGKATLQSGTKTVNNMIREHGSDLSNLEFVNYAAYDFEILDYVSSVAYAGSPTTTESGYDFQGFPTPIPILGYFFGAYGSYNIRTIAP